MIIIIIVLFGAFNFWFLSSCFDLFGIAGLIFTLNLLMYLFGLVHSLYTRKLSLNLIHSFFGYLFFWIVPILASTNGKYVYFLDNLNTHDLILKTQTIILLWNFIFYFTYFVLIDKVILKITFLYRKIHSSRLSFRISIITICSLVIIFYLYKNGGMTVFFFRATEILDDVLNPIMRLFYANLFRPFIFTLFMILTICNTHKLLKVPSVSMITLFLLVVLTNFPTAPPRFYTLSIILSVYAILFMKIENNGFRLLPYIPLGLMASFIIDVFRNPRSFSELTFNTSSVRLIDTLHFDAYETLMMAIKYVQINGTIHGENIIGALTFYVPRILWESKPIPTSNLLVRSGMPEKTFSLDPNFENISCPLIGEAFIGMGFFGVLIFAASTAFICAVLDSFLKFDLKKYQTLSIVQKIILILTSSYLGLFLFNLRGALMSTFAYTIGFTLAYLLALRITGFRFRMRLNFH